MPFVGDSHPIAADGALADPPYGHETHTDRFGSVSATVLLTGTFTSDFTYIDGVAWQDQ